MRALTLSVAMVAAVGVAAAQQDKVKAPSGVTLVMPDASCPVGFSAEVSARAVMHSAEEDERYGTAPILKLSFLPKDMARVVRASVTVHGLPVGSRLMLVGNGRDGVAAERFELAAAKGLWGREVRVRTLAVVKWAEITEMRYEDGRVWRPTRGEVCRAAPSLYREVNAVAVK